jgi:hypothetical protein
MKITALVVIAMSLALAVSAQGAGKVRVCVNSGSASFLVLARAEALASQMFATAGVSLEWRSAGSAACKNSDAARAVVLDFAINTAPSEHPGALAYALPYQRAQIVVLFDRIAIADGPGQVSTILAHVMTHEIAHLLEGFSRHSQTGVMKARWDAHDFVEMAHSPLPFAPEDIDLIERGLRVHLTGN